jgi:hypothetical protein
MKLVPERSNRNALPEYWPAGECACIEPTSRPPLRNATLEPNSAAECGACATSFCCCTKPVGLSAKRYTEPAS